MGDTLSMETTILAMAMLILAAALLIVGVAGLTERLPYSRWLGIRVPSVQASETAWRSGHRAAAAPMLAAAGPPLLLAGTLLSSPPALVQDWLLAYIVVGLLTGGLIALAVRQADRAAREVADT